MHNHLLKFLTAALLITVFTTRANAQIVLQQATGITQTKATLSANFPDLAAEHGFQYKYGTLPEIDEFSKTALSSLSDPVKISTDKTNGWSARSVKGWVESNGTLSVGQTSVMSADVKFYEPTTLTFEWSVDSEERIGILSFIVDGETIYEISGAVDFTEVSYQATAGEHTLQWQYKKTAATNVGLDLGMVRNINLQNTTEGDWINSLTAQLQGLYPGQNYLYRAYVKSGEVIQSSSIMQFRTLDIGYDDISASDITQTSASVNVRPNFGDATDVEFSMLAGVRKCPKLLTNADLEYRVLNSLQRDSTLIDFEFSPGWQSTSSGGICNQNVNISYVKAKCILTEKSDISFSWQVWGYYSGSGKYSKAYFYVDGVLRASTDHKKLGTDTEDVKLEIEPGYHVFEWKFDLEWGTYDHSYARLAYVNIPNVSVFSNIVDPTPVSTFPVSMQGLKPNTEYGVIIQSTPKFNSELPERWINGNTKLFTFITLNVKITDINCINTTQSTSTIHSTIDGGDATVIATGLQYKDATGSRWTDFPKNVTGTELLQKITRLKPNTSYHYRSYIQARDCDTVFSETADFTTLPVEALKPTVKRISQHEVTLEGKVRFGDAVIYQRGMQFRKVGVTDWEEVEDGGNDSIYTLVKKNLEMGQQYEARTYIQPAGCDVIYSDISSFKTYDRYFGDDHLSKATQTTLNLSVNLLTFDEGTVVEESGFQYVFISDGFHRKTEQFVPSDTMRVSGVIKDGWLTASLSNLTPGYYVKYRAYLKINGEYIYSNKETENWKGGRTEDALLDVEVKELTQSSITLKLDATQDGDAVVSELKYAFGNWLTEEEGLDLAEYQACDNELKLNNLKPDTQYYLYFSGTTNGRLHPLLVHYPDPQIDEYVKCYYFTTKPVSIQANFSNVTQTKATMKVNVDAGDATVSDLKYRLNSGEYKPCGKTVNFEDLIPGITYTVSFTGKVNGNDVYWTHPYNSEKAYSFTTRRVSVSSNASDVNQTSAAISWSYDCGDATYVSSGIVYGKTTLMEETQTIDKDKGEKLITELLPTATYYYQVYVETKEGGRTYSTRRSFTTTAISCTTLSASSLSNRSATLNGTINCDDNSSAEFGFQWKQMEGWASEPAFTKGKKTEDGSISVALVNGMLEPNLDYQYRAAVRYKGVIYSDTKWQTFRTESEYVFYPANVYTMYRTDRENNRLVLCGYFVAGSEEVVSQGYEYWKSSSIRSNGLRAASNNVIQITTDESMTHSLDLKTLSDGNYSVRAFVKTSSGTTMYGETLIFGVKDGSLSGIEFVESDKVSYSISDHILNIYNASDMSCVIYNMQGQIVGFRQSMTDDEQFTLATGFVYIVKLSDGTTYKIII